MLARYMGSLMLFRKTCSPPVVQYYWACKTKLATFEGTQQHDDTTGSHQWP